MAKEKDELWMGGSWEQSTTRYRPPDTPDSELTKHVRLSQSIRRWKRQGWGVLRRACGILVSGALMAGIIVVAVTHPASPLYLSPTYPWEGNGGGNYGGGGLPQQEQDAFVEPTIRRAKPVTENIISLQETVGGSHTPQEIYNQNLQSVVYIESMQGMGISSGTGIVLTEDGYIATNAHVLSGASETMVCLWDESIYPATLVGWNANEDLAVLKIEAEGLTPATFASTDDLQVGDPAYAIGNPLGAEYRSTFTDGIISALDRYLDIDGVYMSLIQTTTPINMGNSGGALLNEQGQVVGITTIKIMSDEGTVENMGFAIPSDRVVKVVNCMAKGIEIVPPAMGITVLAITDPMAGLQVQEVTEGSYAQIAGVLPRDIITHADGEPLKNTADLQQIMSSLLVGDTITLTINRDGEILDLKIQLMNYADVHGDTE